MDTLLFCVKTLSDRIFARLRGRALRLSACEITVELENHKQVSISLTLPVPQSASSGLLPILRDRLNYEFSESQKKRLDSPISTLFLRATETAPASFSQKHFFSPEEQQSEAWESFLGRVLPRLGEENVFFARPVQKHRPESSWRKITRELLFQELTTKHADRSPSDVLFPERPTLLLKEPVPLSWERDLIRCEGLQKHWQVLKTSFAERLSGEWWEEAGGFAREYYQIIAHELSPRRSISSSSESPIRLWIYFTPQNQAFLHGYFD
jgi:protein ImuB